jgi:rare lipoprotein A
MTIARTQVAVAALSYAPQRAKNSAADAFDALEGKSSRGAAGEGAWGPGESAPSTTPEPFVAAGTFTDKAEAERVREQLAAFGRTTFDSSFVDGGEVYSVDLHPDGRNSLDSLLKAAWRNGAPDAIAVRD